MKFAIAIALILTFIACSNESQSQKIEMKTQLDSVAYSIGWSIGENISRDSLELNTAIIKKAMDDVIAGDSGALSSSQREEVMRAFSQVMQERAQQKEAEAKNKNIEEGKKFLEANKSKEGVKVTESGLQYKVVSQGNGPKPAGPTAKVKVHYTGKLLNGDVFDSSVERGEPAEFALNQVIKGWTEGLQLMNVGSKYIFWIPSDLAYGERQAGPKIAPNSTLMFEVELLEIVE